MTKRLLICTDLDRTLLPNGKQLESPGAREAFTRLVSRPEVTLAYASGRHRTLVEEAINDYQLPIPDWVIGDVGTTLYQIKNDAWQDLSAWEQDVSADWQGLTALALRPLFTDLTALRLQDEARQNRYKLSYYLPLETDVHALQREMSSRLNLARMPTSLIFSVDEASSMGLLDVVPALATKLHALEFLIQHQGFDLSNTVFAGDSGNDLPVLSSAIQSVLVANADDDVVEQAKNLSFQQGTLTTLYQAKGDFLSMNGNYSAGILEGIAHYHPDTQGWMEKNYEP
ncbi:MAG: HAD-IIB family hydrolase [Methylobacter sp.]|nr:HAD-IIB family hydrolase [Methylococcales bacterium]MDD5113464.1 HAD-IIB family hydrolase [Methylobacter sp.]